MRKIYQNSVTLLIFLMLFSTANAKIWRVNSDAAFNADFSTFSDACNSANEGDTIFLEPSNAGYTPTNIDKRLIIIGSGYNLDKNLGLQYNNITTYVTSITFTKNLSTSSAGSKIIGVETSAINFSVPNITIQRCRTSGINMTAGDFSGCTIIQNYIDGNISFSGVNNILDVFIANNYVKRILSNIFNTGIIQNNIIVSEISVYNFTVFNNILTSGTFSLNNNTYYNNIGNSSQFGTSNGNQNIPDIVNIFECWPGCANYDASLKLKAGSPAIGAGFGGADCGIFGGSNPYVLSGIAQIPSIYDYIIKTSSPTNLQVNLKLKSNN
jgi:hypothetical protein